MFPLDLPDHIKTRAAAVARAQSSIPDSPVSFADGRIEFCAAACIAAAALGESETGAARFVESIRHDGKTAVIAAFENMGLTALDCHAVMKLNDRTPREKRLNILGFVLGF